MKIGFVGLGVMGNHMCRNLVKNQKDSVLVYDMNEAAVTKLVSDGAIAAKNLSEIGREAEVIFTSLPNGAIVESVILGKNGLLESAKSGTVFIDLSSITPRSIRHIHAESKKKGVEVLDAPVSGGEAGAEKGTLTLMVGGERDCFEKITPLLECIGSKIYHVGEIGAGDTMKLVNNMLLGINMVAVAEAFTLGKKAGLNPETMFEIIGQSSGNSYALTAKYPGFIAKGNFEPGFMVQLQHKDLQLALDTAKDLRVPSFLGNIAQQMYTMADDVGFGREDISSVIKLYEQWVSVQVRKEEKEC